MKGSKEFKELALKGLGHIPEDYKSRMWARRIQEALNTNIMLDGCANVPWGAKKIYVRTLRQVLSIQEHLEHQNRNR